MLALILIALCITVMQRQGPADAKLGVRRVGLSALAPALAAAVLAVGGFIWLNLAPNLSALAAPIRRLATNPTILAITSDIAVGHPLVRQVNGRWVSRVCSLWITAGVEWRRHQEQLDPVTDARLEAYAARDLVMVVDDIARERPDIILIENISADWSSWARSRPTLAEQLSAYRDVAIVNNIRILQRNDRARDSSAR
jgi:hypothetical protein